MVWVCLYSLLGNWIWEAWISWVWLLVIMVRDTFIGRCPANRGLR